jgi:hypothetical protein
MMKVNKVVIIGTGTLLVASLVVLLMKLSEANPIYTAIIVLLVAIIGLFTITRQMAVSRKGKAKGAAKRRKQLLPMFYKKKKKKRKSSGKRDKE